MRRYKKLNKKGIKYLLLIMISLLGTFGMIYYHSYKSSNVDIEKILKSESYNYLPKEAKNYIEQVYKETGNVLLTEKNKEENIPYLNPKFIKYLTMSSEQKSNQEIIPTDTIIDYIPSKKVSSSSSESLPDKFDLRNVDGKNYVTPVENQGNLGICWTFASASQAESYVLLHESEETTRNFKGFSKRQIDYATAEDGILDYENEYSLNKSPYSPRYLGGGGNFDYAMRALTNGVSLYEKNNDWSTYNTDLNPKKLHEVLNYSKSLYEVNSTVSMPYYDYEDSEIREEYLNYIKNQIKSNGGAYVGTSSPDSKCAIKEKTTNMQLIYDDDNCESESHAMQIIGWDDNLEYSFCPTENGHSSNTSLCNEEEIISGKGVWLLKNSWGEVMPYVYLAYDSLYSDISFITNMSKASDKTWDNTYIPYETYDIIQNWKHYSRAKFEKKSDVVEKLDKMKIYINAQNETFNIEISDGSENDKDYKKITKELNVSMPGFYTMNLRDENINLTSNKFMVRISNSHNISYYTSMQIYTNNVSDEVYVQTDDVVYEQKISSKEEIGYQMRVKSLTRNISSNSELTYKLFDSNNIDLSSYLNYQDNIVAENNVNTLITLNSSLDKGDYKLKIYYNNEIVDECNIKINHRLKNVSGTGTKENPYIITTPWELSLMRSDLKAYYKLGNDIDMMSATSKGGELYIGDEGWIPIGRDINEWRVCSNFEGSFDGDGHTISGLNSINNGLFCEIGSSTKDVEIKNINLKDFNVSEYEDIPGSLLGVVSAYQSNQKTTVYIKNISVLGTVKSDIDMFLINIYGSDNFNVEVDGIFNSALEDAIFGYVYSDGNVKIKNIENFNARNIIYSFGGNIDIENVINTSGNIINEIYYNVYGDFRNIYYLTGTDLGMEDDSSENVNEKTLTELKDENTYSQDFLDVLKFETIDNVKRLPILKFVNFNEYYTRTVSDNIVLTKNQSYDLNEFVIVKENVKERLKISSLDSNKLSIDSNNILKALEACETKIHIENSFDGYEKDIDVTIIDNNRAIKFNSNGGTGNIENTTFVIGKKFSLPTNTFEKTGYIFKEWNTEASGTGTIYQDGQEIILEDDITLYAQWIPITYKIKYHSNLENDEIIEKNYLYDTDYNLDENIFSRVGYIFKEWNTESNGSGTSYEDQKQITNLCSSHNCEINLYAQWNKIEDNDSTNFIDYVQEDNYVKNIVEKTSVQTYKTKISTSYNVEIYNNDNEKLSDEDLIFTGSITKIIKDGNVIEEYVNIVTGDINGDGLVTITDVSKLYSYVRKTLQINEDYYLIASDVNSDDTVSITDVSKIYSYVRKVISNL